MRDHNLLIPDIKHFRMLTILLGKLGLDTCRRRNDPPPPPYTYSDNYKEWSYGLGLKETKDLVERTFHYAYIKGSPLDQFQKNNQLHEIKRTRQLLHMLKKFGLKLDHIPDSTLGVAKGFVTRMRAR